MGTNYTAGGVEDLAPVPRHEFTEANDLHLIPFDEDATARLDCPDCEAICNPGNLGEAVDWALGHKCEPAWVADAIGAERE